MEDSEWQEQKSRKNRKSKNASEKQVPLFKSSIINKNAYNANRDAHTQNESYEKLKRKQPNINWWLMFCVDGNIEKLILAKLQDLNYEITGKISSLWDCLFNQFGKSPNANENINSGSDMKNNIYEGKLSDITENGALKELCSKFKLKIRISSIDKNLEDINYGDNRANICIRLLHIGLAYFLSLTEANGNTKYKFSSEDRKILSELSTSTRDMLASKQKFEQKKQLDAEHANLNRIRKLLQGKEQKAESYIPKKMPNKKLMYEIYTDEQIDAMKNLILCELKLLNAHSGIALPLQRTADNHSEIKLNSRRNCGYNAFQSDIVYVKVIDKKNRTGKVIGVYESDHRPVNNIYICKVSRDQGSLMIPLDKSIPKIHVDNEPGRRQYERVLLTKKTKTSSLSEQQKSVSDREMESAKYADNIYYSIYKIEIEKNEDRPTLKDLGVKEFNPETCEHFFIVYYQYWDPNFMYPSGKIIGILTSCESFNDSFPLISSMCNIETLDINKSYLNEVGSIEKQAKCICDIPGQYLPLGAMVFTIDNETTTDMDDAISYHKDQNDIVIGVHISNVTKYISSTHEIYQQAKSRFCTFYPPKFSNIPPIHLLDKKLATDVLSLVPNKPRDVVSVFFKFNEEMFQNNFKLSDINYPTCEEGVIVSKYKLNYNSVSHWLKQSTVPKDVDKDLFIALIETYKIARHLRRARLPESYFVRSVNNYYEDFQFEKRFEAEILIEEFMLLANEYVARIIYEKYPDFTLLRIQDKVTNYDDWLEKLYKNTNMNFAGQLKEYCSLLGSKVNNLSGKKNLIVSRKFYDKFCENLKNDPEKAQNLLQCDVIFNDFYFHITKWYSINAPARYQCSVENSVSNEHFSLNKRLYTHFTSPIRRFSDIVVHRLLKSVINNSVIDDISLDINEVCMIANRKSKNNKNFEKICAPFEIFDETKKTCFILDCVCSEITNEELHVAHPLLQKASCTKDIKFARMDLDTAPVQLKMGEEVDNCTLKWKKIIYSYVSNSNNSMSNKFIIDNHIFDSRLPSSCDKLFREIRRSYQPVEKHKNDLELIKASFKISDYTNVVSSDSISLSNPVINIELPIYTKNTMRIQFCKYKVNGLPKINPQLFIITPTFQICLIHRDDPVRYFIPDGKLGLKHNSIKKRFASITEYQEYFSPLIRIEALEETISEHPAFSLLSVPIQWIIGKSSKKSQSERYGVIKLSYKFCKYRNVIFSDENEIMVDRLDYLIQKGILGVGGDLLCLRYKNDNCKHYWVGHGEILFVGKLQISTEHYKVIVFMLTQSEFDIFNNNTDEDQFDIDVYLRSVVSKRQQQAVNGIENHPLLKDVILGTRSISKTIEYHDLFAEIKNLINSIKFMKLNNNQSRALENALNHKLSLIWGPPGTGKTLIGCILSYAFSFKNLRNGSGVVLYCGPSNDCVNLVASEMKRKFGLDCPKLLRIYGKQQELGDFPLPGFIVKNHTKLTQEMQECSLHYLIRNKNNSRSNTLKNFDMEFKAILDNQHSNFNSDYHKASEGTRQLIYEKVLIYTETVKQAKIEFIKSNPFDMVLCTTPVTVTQIMDLFEIKQIIIDEAGMCKEPETLIPISSADETVENVVLIGDHKQLRPVIRSKVANKRGLQISLFERYQELRPELVTLLNFQYRMHPSICEFPSKQFYNGKLKTQISPLWTGLSKEDVNDYYYWNGIDYSMARRYYQDVLDQSNYNAIPNEKWPQRSEERYVCFDYDFEYYPERIIFIDVVGDEVIQSVTTTLGNENSRGNNVEVEVVEYIYKQLIHNLKPPRQAPNYVTILTQYKLQQHLLFERCQRVLRNKNIKSDPLVKTVIRSQGSENEYVIFSTVRSLRNQEDISQNPSPGWEKQYLGFITDPNQINVALTRARKGLIIIGNKRLLRVNQMWKRLIDNLERRGCVIENYLDFL